MAFTFIAFAENFSFVVGTSLACLTTLNVEAGDLLVCSVSAEDGTMGTFSVSDGGSNILTMSSERNSGSSYQATGYRLSAVANASATFTFSSGSTDNRGIIVLQFRPDAEETVSLDPASGNPNPATGSGTTGNSGNISTTGTDVVAVGMAKWYNQATATNHQIGGVAATIKEHTDAGAKQLHATWYRILTEAMSNGNAHIESIASTWVTDIIGFKSAAAGGATPLPPASMSRGMSVGMNRRLVQV